MATPQLRNHPGGRLLKTDSQDRVMPEEPPNPPIEARGRAGPLRKEGNVRNSRRSASSARTTNGLFGAMQMMS